MQHDYNNLILNIDPLTYQSEDETHDYTPLKPSGVGQTPVVSD